MLHVNGPGRAEARVDVEGCIRPLLSCSLRGRISPCEKLLVSTSNALLRPDGCQPCAAFRGFAGRDRTARPGIPTPPPPCLPCAPDRAQVQVRLAEIGPQPNRFLVVSDRLGELALCSSNPPRTSCANGCFASACNDFQMGPRFRDPVHPGESDAIVELIERAVSRSLEVPDRLAEVAAVR